MYALRLQDSFFFSLALIHSHGGSVFVSPSEHSISAALISLMLCHDAWISPPL
jgi:hypothetical protein